jgi:hypothetical protein
LLPTVLGVVKQTSGSFGLGLLAFALTAAAASFAARLATRAWGAECDHMQPSSAGG